MKLEELKTSIDLLVEDYPGAQVILQDGKLCDPEFGPTKYETINVVPEDIDGVTEIVIRSWPY